jgi:choline dehydrogenase-like flavoprotein
VVVDRDGTREEYSADVVVTSCGAVNSAALLLASASDAHRNGLGNGSDQVGRHLMMHNNASLIAFFETPNLTKFQKTLGVHDFYFGDGDWPYPMGAIQMNGKSDAVLVSFNALKSEDPAELARQILDFWITTEDLPLDENRVPGRPRRPHQPALHPTNVEAHERLIAKFKGLLDVMRCRNQIQENRHYWGGAWDCRAWPARTAPSGSAPTRPPRPWT